MLWVGRDDYDGIFFLFSFCRSNSGFHTLVSKFSTLYPVVAFLCGLQHAVWSSWRAQWRVLYKIEMIKNMLHRAIHASLFVSLSILYTSLSIAPPPSPRELGGVWLYYWSLSKVGILAWLIPVKTMARASTWSTPTSASVLKASRGSTAKTVGLQPNWLHHNPTPPHTITQHLTR